MTKRGRPKGHKLSEETKEKIAESMTGKVKDIEVRDKISESVLDYWRGRRFSVSDEMCEEYRNCPEELAWIIANAEKIDSFDDIIPERRINMAAIFQEIPREYIEELATYDLDAEFLVILKDCLLTNRK